MVQASIFAFALLFVLGPVVLAQRVNLDDREYE